ncbi:unnamed protein product, partial [Symbiodinium pilosum]
QSCEPDFAGALAESGASRRLALAAATAQLERAIALQNQAGVLLEVGRLRLLQAQAAQAALNSDADGHQQEPARFVMAAFGAWMKALGICPEALSG